MTEEQEARWGTELCAWLDHEYRKVSQELDEDGRLVFDYVSDPRMAEQDNADDVREYARRKEEGCCGSHDWEVTYIDGRVFLLGFTYGH